jgi:hypothetical protein
MKGRKEGAVEKDFLSPYLNTVVTVACIDARTCARGKV